MFSASQVFGQVHRALDVIGALAVDRPVPVAGDDREHAGVHQYLRHRHSGGAGARHRHVKVLDAVAGEPAGVEQRREDHDRRAVLVVVEDRDVELVLQAALDLEAAWRGDVLEVDAAEAGRHQPHGLNDLVRVLGIEADRHGVDVAELLEQHRLALHHGHGGSRADVAQAEHGAAVRDHGHRVRLDRELVGLIRIVVDRHAHAPDARRVGHREVVARLDRRLQAGEELAAAVELEGAVGDLDQVAALDQLGGGDDRVRVVLVARHDGDLADRLGVAHLDRVDRADRAARRAERGREQAKLAGSAVELDPQRQRVLGAGPDGHGRVGMLSPRAPLGARKGPPII